MTHTVLPSPTNPVVLPSKAIRSAGRVHLRSARADCSLTSVSQEELLLDAKATEKSDTSRYPHLAAPSTTEFRSIYSQSIFVLQTDTAQQTVHGLAGASVSPLLAEQHLPTKRLQSEDVMKRFHQKIKLKIVHDQR